MPKIQSLRVNVRAVRGSREAGDVQYGREVGCNEGGVNGRAARSEVKDLKIHHAAQRRPISHWTWPPDGGRAAHLRVCDVVGSTCQGNATVP